MNVAHKNADKPNFPGRKGRITKISFEIDEDLKRDFHIYCINKDKSMVQLVTDFIKKTLEKK